MSNDSEYIDSVAIPGIKFRLCRGSEDFAEMHKVNTASNIDEGDEEVQTQEEFVHYYKHLTNCDVLKDILVAEHDGQIIGYSRNFWDKIQKDNAIHYSHFASVLPEWNNKGIREVFFTWNESRLKEIAEAHDPGIEKCIMCWVSPKADEWESILASNEYTIARFSFLMVRLDLENIPDLPLPEGIIVRPTTPEDYRKIWDAAKEIFADEWAEPEWQDEWYDRWLNQPIFQTELWQIAWHGDEVAGMVRSYISVPENEEFNRKWGYTENIGIRRAYRGKGLAKALIARSLQIVKDQGMEQAALGVDAENPSGAFHLYKLMGFQEYQRWKTYKKEL